jgi:rhodanese-related sulfurtransferase
LHDKDNPTTTKGTIMAGTISREDLQAKINRHDKFTLVETLAEDHFREGHLPGAVNLPPDKVGERASQALPDRNAEVVVYCSSPSCTASEKAAKDLEAQGYKRVLRYEGGKQDWVDAGMSLEGTPHKATTTSRDTVSPSPARASR